MSHPHDPLQPHTHEPNPEPPPGSPEFALRLPDGSERRIPLHALHALPLTEVAGCHIVSTGHGTSGPFTFGGATLHDLVVAYVGPQPWSQVEVISADGFGNRVRRAELEQPDPAGPILLAHTLDGTPMGRADGLVRLIVPSERDDALRQVKWVAQVNVK